MPSASEECRAAWGHGDISPDEPSADLKAHDHLIAAGWRFNPRRWSYIPPAGYEPTERDWSAIEYLVTEWDYGGYEPPTP